MAWIPKKIWGRYKGIINQFQDDAFNDILQLYPQLDYIPIHGEDEAELGPAIEFKCLFLYNYFRTWPIIGYTGTGEVDKQSVVALINLEYLRREHPDRIEPESGRLIYKPDHDLFIHRNDKYMATGDSFVSQADDEPLLFMLILKRFLNQPQL